MKPTTRILAFSGSTRAASYNTMAARVAAEGAGLAGAEVTVINLADYPLPLYDGDLERDEGIPEKAVALRNLMEDHHGFLLASPEYNGSLSGVLKNTIDWVSRPEQGVPRLAGLKDKVVGLISASPGSLGGLRGLVHLRAILNNLEVLVLPVQIAIPFVSEVFDEEGRVLLDEKRQELHQLGRGVVEIAGKLAL